MDLFSSGFLFLIVIASGGIAFWADKLGKKMGKKRLSVFGLRPKHVAALTTVAMGVIVSLLTIGFIALVSRDAREWLREGRGLIVERDRLARDVQVQRGQLSGLTVEIGQDRSRLGEVQDQLRQKQERVVLLDSKVKGLDADLRARSADLEKTKGELAVRQTALERLQAQLAVLRGQAAFVRRQYQETNRLFVQAKTNLDSARLELVAVRKELRNARSDVNTFRLDAERAKIKSQQTYEKTVELARKVQGLEEEVATRTDEVSGLRKQISEYAALRDDAEQRTMAAQAQYRVAAAQLSEAASQLALQNSFIESFLDTAVKTSRQEPLTFGASEEVARFAVPRGASLDGAENALASLLRSARVTAETRGAKGHQIKGRTFDVADVFDRQDPATHESVSGEALKEAVVRRVAGRDEGQVLVATSSLNAFRGEPVALDIAVVPNPMVYRRNETVAEARIDGSQAEDRILGQLSEFVGSQVRERAEKDHMIPRANTAAPYGEIPPLDVLALVRDVKRAGRTVRVLAVAEADTHAADPLRLEFRIK